MAHRVRACVLFRAAERIFWFAYLRLRFEWWQSIVKFLKVRRPGRTTVCIYCISCKATFAAANSVVLFLSSVRVNYLICSDFMAQGHAAWSKSAVLHMNTRSLYKKRKILVSQSDMAQHFSNIYFFVYLRTEISGWRKITTALLRKTVNP